MIMFINVFMWHGCLCQYMNILWPVIWIFWTDDPKTKYLIFLWPCLWDNHVHLCVRDRGWLVVSVNIFCDIQSPNQIFNCFVTWSQSWLCSLVCVWERWVCCISTQEHCCCWATNNEDLKSKHMCCKDKRRCVHSQVIFPCSTALVYCHVVVITMHLTMHMTQCVSDFGPWTLSNKMYFASQMRCV